MTGPKYPLRKIIEKLPGNVWWKDKNLVYLGCNDRVIKVLGLSSLKEFIGKTDHDLWEKSIADKLEEADLHVLKTGESIKIEEIIVESNGNQVTMLTNKSPFFDNKNNIIGIVGTSTDITKRKKFEDELKQAKETAEIADRLKLEFIHNMEHDIRTPFWGLLCFTKELEESEPDPTKKEKLSYCVKGAQELFDYCSYIVDFSKNLEGEYPILAKKFKIRESLAKVMSMEMPAAQFKKLTFTVDVKEGVPDVLIGDPDRVQRIFLSLVGNSIKFTHQGHVKISALLGKKTETNVILKFMIEDTGIGINKEQQKYIYEKFTRGTPSNKGLYKGLGIGLYIVKQYIADMHGEIDVESEEGKGSKFICTIPFDLPLLDEALKEPIKVLLVEPDSNLQVSQQDILQKLGCNVDSAATGKEVLNLFSENHYDLIFTALTLSDMSGIALIETLRKNEKEPKTPIIALATYEEKDEEKNAKQGGANEFMAKPLRSERCQKMLVKYISRFELK